MVTIKIMMTWSFAPHPQAPPGRLWHQVNVCSLRIGNVIKIGWVNPKETSQIKSGAEAITVIATLLSGPGEAIPIFLIDCEVLAENELL